MIPRLRLPTLISAALLALLAVTASGCVTGERPTLAANASTGYRDVDDLVARVTGLSATRYTAHYDVLVRFGDTTSEVSASQSAGDRRSLTIGDVRYVVHGQVTKTCTVSTASCVPRIDASRVSDVQMTPDFFGTSLIARIELDASRAIGQPVTSTENTSGGEALCVAIPITDATTTYCVLDNGVLTRMEAADLVVTMTGYSDDVDETLYAEGRPPTTPTTPSTTASG